MSLKIEPVYPITAVISSAERVKIDSIELMGRATSFTKRDLRPLKDL